MECSPSRLNLAYHWRIKELPSKRVVFDAKNLITNYGLTAFASAPGGVYVAPQWLVIQNTSTTVSSATSSTIVVPTRIDQTGDTTIVVGVGPTSINQEVVTFTSVTGSGPYTYNLSPNATKSHIAGELVLRNPVVTDTLANITNEVQYDVGSFPTQRAQSIGGYTTGVGNYIMQFLLTGAQALMTLPILGLSDTNIVGTGNLHNELVSGYIHTSGIDLEIDVSITLTNI